MGLIKKFLLWRSKRKLSQLKEGDLFHIIYQTNEVWGILKNINNQGSHIWITYYDFETYETKLLSFENKEKKIIYLINKDSDICKHWFTDHPIEDYLTHRLDCVRKWAKNNITLN